MTPEEFFDQNWWSQSVILFEFSDLESDEDGLGFPKYKVIIHYSHSFFTDWLLENLALKF